MSAHSFPSASLAKSLREAAHYGNRAKVEEIISVIPQSDLSPTLNAADDFGRTALILSIKKRHDEIATLLIDSGANVNTSDRDGRTALMYSIWKCRMVVFKKLVGSAGIKITAVDKRYRTAIHHLASDHDRSEKFLSAQKPEQYANEKGKTPAYDKEILDILLDRNVDPNKRDGFGKTCLHHAASTGNNRLVQHLLQPGIMNANALIVKDSMDRYPVHIAAERNNIATFRTLMDVSNGMKKPNIDDHISGGWTALHLACRNPDTSIDFVRCLVQEYRADATKKTWDGQSAVDVAAGVGKFPVIEYLLKKFKIKLSQRNAFGTSALFHAAKKGHDDTRVHKDIIKLFAPWGDYVTIEKDAEEAARLSYATIIDFNLEPDEEDRETDFTPNTSRWDYTRKEISIFDLIYAKDKDDPKEPAFSCLRPKTPNGSKISKSFRWIHLPANNISWCRDLTSKHFIENVLNDIHVHGPGDLTKSFLHYERRGKMLHSRYMTPICENVRNFQRFGGSAPHDHPLSRTDSLETPKKAAYEEREFIASLNETPGRTFRLNALDPACDTPSVLPEIDDEESIGRSATSINSMYLFMPFLHYETFKHLVYMQCVADKIHPGEFEWPEKLKARLNLEPHEANEALFKAHLTSENPSLHIRRTLDQFFYQNIDTHYRDTDQVMERYQRTLMGRTEKLPADDDKLLMVDQLWMWVLSKDLVLTAFPTQWNPTLPDRLNVFDGIIQSIDSADSNRVYGVYELAMAIVGHCYGTLDRHAPDEQGYQVLDKFKQSVGLAMAQETEYFEKFKRKVANSIKTNDGVKSDGPDALPDITSEISLLTEVKDIMDELDILKLLFAYQLEVRNGMVESFISIHSDAAARRKALKAFQDHRRLIDQPQGEIKRMQDQVKRIQDSILASLDLKQKHASTIQANEAAKQANEAAKQAENTAKQAEETARQGRTLMVFTLVTVVFLPLSFISSFFTMSISTFPRNGDNIELPIRYVAKFVFGIGTPVAAMLVLAALSAETTAKLMKKLQGALSFAFLEHGDKNKKAESGSGTQSGNTNPQESDQAAELSFARRTKPPDIENGPTTGEGYLQEKGAFNQLTRMISRSRVDTVANSPAMRPGIAQHLSPNGSSSKVASSSALPVR